MKAVFFSVFSAASNAPLSLFGNCGNGIAENVKKKKKKYFGNCGNGIAENGEKKCCEICERVKEKLSHPQYFHNKSHVINYY